MELATAVKLMLLLSLLANVGMVVFVAWLSLSEGSKSPLPCGGGRPRKPNVTWQALHPYTNVFEDLNEEELSTVLDYLYRQPELDLVPPSYANLTSNYIYNIELQVPDKTSVLDFLDRGGVKPEREAKAIVFLSNRKPPIVQELVVGPLPHPMRHRPNPRRRADIPFRVRQFSNVEMLQASELMQRSIGPRLEKLLHDSFQANLSQCQEQCLTFTAASMGTAFSRERRIWISTMYQVEFSTLHPVGFQFLLNMEGIDASAWRIEQVWYANRLFPSFEDLLHQYERNEIPRLQLKFPTPREGQGSLPGSLHPRGSFFPHGSQQGPRQVEPQGSRYRVRGQHVDYLAWSFNFRMSYATGLQLYDVRFLDQRIVYEISLQEIAVLYSGANPSSFYSHLVDSVFGIGNRAQGLVAGVDCPDHAHMVDTVFYNEDFLLPRIFPNALCLFEHDPAIPLRRHKANSMRSGFFYSGLPDYVLVLRTVFVMYNYDYIVDVVLHQNGALEMRTLSTGYILSAFHYSQEAPFGFQVAPGATGSIHQHLFHYKVDLDILGTKNRYETLNVKSENFQWPWLQNSSHNSQLAFDRELKHSEKEAAYHFNFSTPKYHVFYNDRARNQFGQPRGYRLLGRAFSNQLLPKGCGAEVSLSWARYQLAVTRQRDAEETSSSMYAIFDSQDPIVDFQSFLDDDENLVDQDLVAWVTLGTHHIPHTEDVPNVPTTGSDLTFILLPFNYFPEDPSMSSQDALRLDAILTEEGGIEVQRYSTAPDVSCVSEPPDSQTLARNRSAIFMTPLD